MSARGLKTAHVICHVISTDIFIKTRESDRWLQTYWRFQFLGLRPWCSHHFCQGLHTFKGYSVAHPNDIGLHSVRSALYGPCTPHVFSSRRLTDSCHLRDFDRSHWRSTIYRYAPLPFLLDYSFCLDGQSDVRHLPKRGTVVICQLSLTGSTHFRGPASGDLFSLLCLVLKMDWKYSVFWHLASYRLARRASLNIYTLKELYIIITLGLH